MAWIFQLALECGTERPVAEKIVAALDRKGTRFLDGSTYELHSDMGERDEEGNWWVSITPARTSGEFVDSRDSEMLLGILARWLYAELHDISGYRFAHVGIEAYQFNTFSNIPSLLKEVPLHGFVLRSDLYLEWSEPPGFETFTSGYVWRPYQESHLSD
jgi:hypothetical protein